MRRRGRHAPESLYSLVVLQIVFLYIWIFDSVIFKFRFFEESTKKEKFPDFSLDKSVSLIYLKCKNHYTHIIQSKLHFDLTVYLISRTCCRFSMYLTIIMNV